MKRGCPEAESLKMNSVSRNEVRRWIPDGQMERVILLLIFGTKMLFKELSPPFQFGSVPSGDKRSKGEKEEV